QPRAGGGGALRGPGGEGAGEDGFGDAGDRHPEVECRLHGPRTGALGAGLVEDDVDEGFTRCGVRVAEHFGGDFDEVAFEFAAVPFGEDVGDFGGGFAGFAADEVVRFGDELHVGVFDAVVDHL